MSTTNQPGANRMFEFSQTVRVTQADQELAYGLSEAMEEIKQLRQQVTLLTAALTKLDQSTKLVQRPTVVKARRVGRGSVSQIG